jgi:hypothetical protein
MCFTLWDFLPRLSNGLVFVSLPLSFFYWDQGLLTQRQKLMGNCFILGNWLDLISGTPFPYSTLNRPKASSKGLRRWRKRSRNEREFPSS